MRQLLIIQFGFVSKLWNWFIRQWVSWLDMYCFRSVLGYCMKIEKKSGELIQYVTEYSGTDQICILPITMVSHVSVLYSVFLTKRWIDVYIYMHVCTDAFHIISACFSFVSYKLFRNNVWEQCIHFQELFNTQEE